MMMSSISNTPSFVMYCDGKRKHKGVQQSLPKRCVLISRPSEQHAKWNKCNDIAVQVQKYTPTGYLIPVYYKSLYLLKRMKIITSFIITASSKHITKNKEINDTDYIKHKQHQTYRPELFSIYLLQDNTPTTT